MKEKDVTSIQISVKHRDKFKAYCDKHGFNMSSLLEKIIDEKTAPIYEPNDIYNGKGRPVKGNTVFNRYDDETAFQKDCYESMIWAAHRLGYPVVAIEMNDLQFYATFEEAVDTYYYYKGRDHAYGYNDLDQKAKGWIKQYFFALAKEILGTIRQKYQTVPIPGGEVSLDGADLKFEARADQEILRTKIP